MTRRRVTSPNRRGDDAFTIVEVLVAAIIIGIVAVAAGTALRSSMGGTTNAKVASRGKAVAVAVLQKMQANTSWLATCSAVAVNVDCPVPLAAVMNARAQTELLDEPNGTVTHTPVVTVRAVDLAADGAGAADQDSQTRDLYQIHVVNTVTGPVVAGGSREYAADGSVNPVVRGRSGTVRIRMCAVDGQVDERYGTGLCSSSSTSRNAATIAPFDIEPSPANLCADADALRMVCSPFLAARASGVTDSRGVPITRMRIRAMASYQVQLQGPVNGTSRTYNVITGPAGSVDVPNLDPGRYRINITNPSWAGGRWVTWSSHSVPSSGDLVVEKGGVREATIMMRPEMPTVRVRVETLDRTDPLNHVLRAGAEYPQTVRLMSIPSGRSILERGTGNNGWTRINRGDRTVTLADSYPGLYSNHLLHFSSGYTSRFYGNPNTWVWIDPNGTTTRPATLTIRQEHCDAAARHARVLALCGTLQRWCWVGATFIGECNDNPTVSGGVTSGGGVA